MENFLLEVKTDQGSRPFLQLERRVETVDAGDVQEIAEQHRAAVPVQGVMFYGKPCVLWGKPLHQHAVQLRYLVRAAQKCQQRSPVMVIGQVIKMFIVPVQKEETAGMAVTL